jgi:hypothetical protein
LQQHAAEPEAKTYMLLLYVSCYLQALAHKQRELLQQVQQACAPLYSSSSSSSSSVPPPAESDVAWALSMVKSRTFGRQLQPQQQHQQQQQHGGGSIQNQHASSQSLSAAAAAHIPAAAAAAAAAELEPDDGDDDGNVVLLMVPYIDMINHSPHNNCNFGLDWDNGW